jgi:hypothetical protein
MSLVDIAIEQVGYVVVILAGLYLFSLVLPSDDSATVKEQKKITDKKE